MKQKYIFYREVIDHRWSPRRHEIGDFLARNQVPYQWLDVEASKEATHLLEQLGLGRKKLPVVIFPDGSYLVNPDVHQIAEKINLKTHAEKPFYDLIIIGSIKRVASSVGEGAMAVQFIHRYLG